MAINTTIKARAVIFAGGIGTRMWPVSRTTYPKQFEKIINNKSTIELTIDHLRPEFAWEDIYISTNILYVDIIRRQLPKIPQANIIGEPARRDVAPAVGYSMAIMERLGAEPVVILWSDHIRNKPQVFKKIIKTGVEFINKNPEKFLFVGQKPRFANQNLGWIEIGKTREIFKGFKIYNFNGLVYQPDKDLAEKFYKSKRHFWNPGYWVVKPSLVMQQYKKFAPDMFKKLLELADSYGLKDHKKTLNEIYPSLEKISFDKAILEKLEFKKGAVMVADMGWSDVGTWQALKETLQKNPEENVCYGKTYSLKTINSLVYNYTPKLIATVGLKDTAVVVTSDVILVCNENCMSEIKTLVEILGKNNKYKKYT